MSNKENSNFHFNNMDFKDNFAGSVFNKDKGISIDAMKENHRKEELYARHEIVKNIYVALIYVTKPKVIIMLVFCAILLYPFSRIEMPIKYSLLLKDYLSILFEIITACVSFVLGAIISNWASSKFNY